MPGTDSTESSRDPTEAMFNAELGKLGIEAFAPCRDRPVPLAGSKLCIVGMEGEDDAR